jgi:hypothetical protein
VNGAPSSEHWNASSAAGVTSSVPEKVKVALVLVVVDPGPESIVVSGAIVSAGSSTVQERVTGGSSARPYWLVAWTSNVWSPSSRLYSTPEMHAPGAAASREHVNVTPV